MSLLLLLSPSQSRIIANNANTTVTDLGSNLYRIEKTSGGAGWNADAVSTAPIAGDFLLTARALQTTANLMVGVNADPLTDSIYTSLDRQLWFASDGNVYYGEASFLGSAIGTYTASDYWFLRRVGTDVEALKGATDDVASATLAHTFNDHSATVYFDSSFDTASGQVEVKFAQPAIPSPISGSAGITFSTSGALVGSGSLSGSSSPAFAPAGILKGAGALSGASSPAFTTSASGFLLGALVGSSAPSFSASGALSASGRLVGASAASFAPAGSLAGQGALAGSTAATFSPSGMIGATGALAGASAYALTAAGTLQGAAAAAGSASLVFTLAGDLISVVQASPIAGASQLAFSVMGSMSGESIIAISRRTRNRRVRHAYQNWHGRVGI
jgi:hypothetical protein